MSLIGLRSSIAHRHKRITLQAPGAAVPDGDGGYTQAPVPLNPPVTFGHVRPAGARDLERIAAGTVISQASHLVSLPFHPGVTTTTELHVEDFPNPDRRFAVITVLNPDERNAELELLCAEVVR